MIDHNPAGPEPIGESAAEVPVAPSPASENAVIELDGLTVRFGKATILDRLEARLSGRAIGLLGPNGAGKTTLLHTLLGFHDARSGTARVLGHDVRRERRAVRREIGYMPERESFVAGMSGVRFVQMMAELSGLPAAEALERAHQSLFYVGLGEARYRNIETYSFGMKQLVKFAQAIVHGPRVLLLDEPTNGLDPPARSRMLRLIREVRDSGRAHILLSSHLLRDVEECCEEVLILRDGRISAHSDLAAERRTHHKFLVLELRGDGEASFIEALTELGAECAEAPGRRWKMVLPEGVGVADLYRLASERSLQIRRLDYKRDSLEEIFLQAMGA